MFYYLAAQYYVILGPGLFQSASVCTIVVMSLVHSFCLFPQFVFIRGNAVLHQYAGK